MRLIVRCSSLLGVVLLIAGCAHMAPSDVQRDPERLIVLAVRDRPDVVPLRASTTPRGYDMLPRYSASSRALATLDALKREYRLDEQDGWTIAPLGVYCVVLRLPDGAQREEWLLRLQADPRVQLAQPMQEFDTLTAAVPAPATPTATLTVAAAVATATAATAAARTSDAPDPYLSLQQAYQRIEAGEAQRVGRGAGARVAVVDTGLDRRHPELAGRVVAAFDGVRGDMSDFDRDRHGTEVAGVIAAAAGNGTGIAGIAPDAQLLALKACWPLRPGGDAARCNSLTLARALVAAGDAGVDIINLSLGGPSDPLLSQLLGEVMQRGTVVVGALPDSGQRSGFPLDVPGVIAATDRLPVPGTLQAPGKDVLTLLPGGGYDFASGSSIAAAHVSGVAALLIGTHQLAPDRVGSVLSESTTVSGMLDACLAMRKIGHNLTCREAGVH